MSEDNARVDGPVAEDASEQRDGDGESVEQLRAELDAAREQSDSYLSLAQRTQADFANYKRRIDLERSNDGQIARAQTIAELLPLLDDLDRAITHMPDELANNAWATGVTMLAGRLQSTLERLGVERLGKEGEEFDPNIHEGVASEPRDDMEPGRVASVFRHGYRIGTRLIRAAQVVVAAEPSHTEDSPPQPDGERPESPTERARAAVERRRAERAEDDAGSQVDRRA